MKTLPNHQFLAVMRKQAAKIASKSSRVCAGDLRSYCQHHEIEPESSNAWGAVFKRPDWRPIGYRVSVTPSRRGGVQRIWARA
jgi:hypothetical protein